MRSQPSSSGQPSGSNDQKKSVFDRLGRQLDAGRSMKRRPSPNQYGDYMPPPPPSMHEPDFGRYGPREPISQAEMEWRYQNERRHMGGPYPRDARHPQMQPCPPPHMPPGPPSHYEMEMGNGRQPPYYSSPHPYHNGPPGPPPPMPMGPGNMPMSMHQQRSSPKYDRHGNPIPNFKDRGGPMRGGPGPMEHHHSMSPSRNFMPPGPMMHPGPMEMPPGMRLPPNGMYPPPRWPDAMEPDFPPLLPHAAGRMMQEGRFSPMSSRRYQQEQQQQQILNSQAQEYPNLGAEAPRYTKWRERRDAITNLDKETAQSSSQTDSLKSTLQQQQDSRRIGKNELPNDETRQSKRAAGSLSKQSAETVSRTDSNQSKPTDGSAHVDNKQSTKVSSKPVRTDPQDISDGEIVDDEDSSDDSEIAKVPNEVEKDLSNKSYLNWNKTIPQSGYTGRGRDHHQYYEPNKKRRLLEREDYSMDYETISDDDLDDFMDEKKVPGLSTKEAKARLGEGEGKSVSEMELLTALGLDWANLVEMSRQWKKGPGKENLSKGSTLSRFSPANYLPTLGITPELAGPDLYDLVLKVCRAQ